MQEYVNSLIEKEPALKMEEEFLLDLFISYKISYDYYGISDDNFKKIFDKAVKMALNKDNFEIRIANILNGMAVKYFLDNYRKDTRLLNNFLIKLKKNNNSNFKILRALGKEFEAKELTLDEELIKMLRQNAPCFQKIIKASGIDDLSNRDLIFVILGKYDNYISLKPLNHSLKWTIITLREVALIINYPLGNLSKDIMKNEVIIDKLRFILAFYDNIYVIRDIAIKEKLNIRIEDIKKVVFNYSLEDLKKLKEDLIVYNTHKEKLDFIYKIYKRINVEETQKKVTLKKTEIYQYFKDAPGVGQEEKIKVIDYLIEGLTTKEAKEVRAFGRGDVNELGDKDKTYSQVRELQKLYDKWVQTGKLPRRKFFTIYDYFPDYLDINQNEKKQMVDELLARFDSNTQMKIRSYPEKGVLTKDEKKYISGKIVTLKDQYEGMIKGDSLATKRKYNSIYEMVEKGNKSEEEVKEAMDYILSSLNTYRREQIEKYFRNEDLTKEEKSRIRNDIYLVIRHFKEYVKTGKLKKLRLNYNINMNDLLNNINTKYAIEWINMDLDKQKLYQDMFELMEYKYMLKGGQKEDFRSVLTDKMLLIIKDMPDIKLEELFRIVKEEINNKEVYLI